MDLIDRIGAVLGLAAFLGLAVLALLYFQQARDIRRLREWAGKAPERAAAAEEGGATSEPAPEEHAAGLLSRISGSLRSGLARVGAPIASAWSALDRRSPVDPRVLVPILAVAAVAAILFLVHPFGLLDSGGESGGSQAQGQDQPPPPDQIEVAVLNGTATPTTPGVPGLANQVGQQVKSAGYKLGQVGDASTSFPTSEVMFQPEHKAEATALAEALRPDLGTLKTQPMSTDIGNLAGGANIAVVVGQDAAQQ